MAKGIHLSQTDKERIRKMYAEGLKPAHICARMGISPATVSFVVNSDWVKKCSRCGRSGKLEVDFHRNGLSSSGKRKYSSRCAKCESERRKSIYSPESRRNTQPVKVWPDRPARPNVESVEPAYV